MASMEGLQGREKPRISSVAVAHAERQGFYQQRPPAGGLPPRAPSTASRAPICPPAAPLHNFPALCAAINLGLQRRGARGGARIARIRCVTLVRPGCERSLPHRLSTYTRSIPSIDKTTVDARWVHTGSRIGSSQAMPRQA